MGNYSRYSGKNKDLVTIVLLTRGATASDGHPCAARVLSTSKYGTARQSTPIKAVLLGKKEVQYQTQTSSELAHVFLSRNV